MADSKWQIGFWVITVLVIGSFTWTTTCYLSNRSDIQKGSDRYYALKEVSNDVLHKIDSRLNRIEDKLGIENREN